MMVGTASPYLESKNLEYHKKFTSWYNPEKRPELEAYLQTYAGNFYRQLPAVE